MNPKVYMNDAFLCLGGNRGNRVNYLKAAKRLIGLTCGRIVKESSIYESKAWGSNSPHNYLNQVVRIQTKLSAEKLIKKLIAAEENLGRKRNGKKYGDRSIDIDILFFNRDIIEEKHLVIPHPRLHLRAFVLKPLAEIAPGMKHPFSGKTIKQMLRECGDTAAVKKYQAPFYVCIEGNIGSGKTTLAQALVKETRAVYLPEQFEKNDLLPLFYEDPGRFAFPLEYSFLLARFQHIRNVFKERPKLVVSDYAFHKCVWFAAVNLKKKDYRFFEKHFHSLQDELPRPDIIFYLQTPAENLLKNIKQRGRAYEQSISAEYLDGINNAYEKGMRRLEKQSLIRIINAPVKKYSRQSLASLIKLAKKHLPKSPR